MDNDLTIEELRQEVLREISTTELLRELMGRERLMDTPANRIFLTRHIDAIVAIDKDHIAVITIDEEAMDALFDGPSWQEQYRS